MKEFDYNYEEERRACRKLFLSLVGLIIVGGAVFAFFFQLEAAIF